MLEIKKGTGVIIFGHEKSHILIGVVIGPTSEGASEVKCPEYAILNFPNALLFPFCQDLDPEKDISGAVLIKHLPEALHSMADRIRLLERNMKALQDAKPTS